MDQRARMAMLDEFPRRQAEVARRLRRRRARPRHSRCQPRLQLRRADPRGRLCPPHRPHGRAGRSGKAFTIATRSDTKYLDAIERLIGQKIEWHDGDLSTVVASEGDDEAPRRGRGAPRRAGRKDESDRARRAQSRPRPSRCRRRRSRAEARSAAETRSWLPTSPKSAARARTRSGRRMPAAAPAPSSRATAASPAKPRATIVRTVRAATTSAPPPRRRRQRRHGRLRRRHAGLHADRREGLNDSSSHSGHMKTAPSRGRFAFAWLKSVSGQRRELDLDAAILRAPLGVPFVAIGRVGRSRSPRSGVNRRPAG